MTIVAIPWEDRWEVSWLPWPTLAVMRAPMMYMHEAPAMDP